MVQSFATPAISETTTSVSPQTDEEITTTGGLVKSQAQQEEKQTNDAILDTKSSKENNKTQQAISQEKPTVNSIAQPQTQEDTAQVDSSPQNEQKIVTNNIEEKPNEGAPQQTTKSIVRPKLEQKNNTEHEEEDCSQ